MLTTGMTGTTGTVGTTFSIAELERETQKQEARPKIQDPRPKIQDPRSKIQDPRSKIQDPRSKIQDRKTNDQEPRYQKPKTKNQKQEPQARGKRQEARSNNQEFKTKDQEPEAGKQEATTDNPRTKRPRSKTTFCFVFDKTSKSNIPIYCTDVRSIDVRRLKMAVVHSSLVHILLAALDHTPPSLSPRPRDPQGQQGFPRLSQGPPRARRPLHKPTVQYEGYKPQA